MKKLAVSIALVLSIITTFALVSTTTESPQPVIATSTITTNSTPQEMLAKSGCCSHHSGVCGCKDGRVVCCDGTLSPSCKCDKSDVNLED